MSMTTQQERIDDLIAVNDELENYFRNTIIPQLFVDAQLILRKFTPPAMKQFSLKATDVGRPIEEIKENFRFPTLIENIQHVIESQEILEKEIQTTDLRWYQMNIIPYVTQKTQKTNGVIITFVEITFRIKDLREQEKLIADHEILLDTLAHDIKNPLNNLILAFEQFKSAGADETQESRSLFAIVERALLKMRTLINELGDGREKDHKYKSESELLSIEHILEDVRLTLQEDIDRSGAKITSDIGVSQLTFSRRKLRSILYNLISNCIKYRSTERAPRIIVKTIRVDDEIIISVIDNGIGIDPGKQTFVFEKYYQIHGNVEGSGIGLFLVREIVNNAGGTITLSSEVGVGTEVKITLKEEQ